MFVVLMLSLVYDGEQFVENNRKPPSVIAIYGWAMPNLSLAKSLKRGYSLYSFMVTTIT